jgi:adenylylsulfate kinase
MVIWLLGLPGAGKTTLGLKLEKYLKQKNLQCCLIDGNIVRDFFNNDLGYTKEERIINMKRIMLAAFLLEKNGIIPVVCNISPFKSMRDFARKKFNNYIEIYLAKPFHKAKEEITKREVYQQNQTPIVGREIPFEEPDSYNLKLYTHVETVEESFDKIIEYLKKELKK